MQSSYLICEDGVVRPMTPQERREHDYWTATAAERNEAMKPLYVKLDELFSALDMAVQVELVQLKFTLDQLVRRGELDLAKAIVEKLDDEQAGKDALLKLLNG